MNESAEALDKEAIKPKALFHAYTSRNLEILKPKAESVRDSDEGPVVFATPDKALASIFLVPTDDTWTRSGLFGDIHYFICSDREKFEIFDKGGAIYSLPTETFENDLNKGLGKKEWTSKKQVVPIEKEIYQSGLEAMLEMGVQVFFVGKETFEKVKESEDFGNSIIRNLDSENEKRGISAIRIPSIHDH
jgi:hypothetical protein